ncbi:MAG: excinuclease ABC subunit UvrC [Candidatus Aminicenantes bacterium]|nr:excinuclease ABC subunit UvrC [Candidatus Aminicenantes bacterium]
MIKLQEKIAGFPETPGIYFFKNAAGGVVYIGKARRLRDRVKSYFQPSDDPKVAAILSETMDVDYILTGSEREAAFLENNFIQQAQPKFNLRLKDDKSFPYLKLTVGEPFPGIYFCRKVVQDGSKTYGPFSPANEARKTILLLAKSFGLRTCEAPVFRGRKRPCLEYDLKLCAGPCVGLIGEAEYRARVRDAKLFLEGRTERLAKALRARMDKAAAEEDFEGAAHWRDVLKAVEQVRIKPAIISVRLEDQDIIGRAAGGGREALYVFVMRRGKVVRSHEIPKTSDPEQSPEASLADGMRGFYAGREVPPRILVPFPPADRAALAAELTPEGGREPEIDVPARGKNKALLEMALRNAERALAAADERLTPLFDLQKALGLPTLPSRIEGFDISNTQGLESVASMVSFESGRPWKDGYRKFKIKTVQGPNDVASLTEVLGRRYGRLLREKAALPDLVLVDGGKPQIRAAAKVLAWLGLGGLPLASLAKREEIVYTRSAREGIRLARTSPGLKLLQHVRDEAHRFAVAFHRKRRAARALKG